MGRGGAHDLNVSKSPMSLWKATPPLPLAGSGELEGKGGKRLGAGRLPEVKVLAPGVRLPVPCWPQLSTPRHSLWGSWVPHWSTLLSDYFFDY